MPFAIAIALGICFLAFAAHALANILVYGGIAVVILVLYLSSNDDPPDDDSPWSY